jgi:hypothetical protein
MTPSAPDAEQLLSPFPWRPRGAARAPPAGGLLVGLLALKFAVRADEPALDPDASYYYDIAAHVRDGDGLVTDVSLFNAGYDLLPAPDRVYPLWPLVLGLRRRVVPLDLAAVWLPTLFYFAGDRAGVPPGAPRRPRSRCSRRPGRCCTRVTSPPPCWR